MLPAITITCKFSDAFLSHIPPEVNDVTNTRPDITTCITETGNILDLGYLCRSITDLSERRIYDDFCQIIFKLKKGWRGGGGTAD